MQRQPKTENVNKQTKRYREHMELYSDQMESNHAYPATAEIVVDHD